KARSRESDSCARRGFMACLWTPWDGREFHPATGRTLVRLCFFNNPRPPLLLQARRGGHWAPLLREERVQATGVEFVGLAAELAAHAGLSFHQRGFGLLAAEGD